jgi:hypothetical protein
VHDGLAHRANDGGVDALVAVFIELSGDAAHVEVIEALRSRELEAGEDRGSANPIIELTFLAATARGKPLAPSTPALGRKPSEPWSREETE